MQSWQHPRFAVVSHTFPSVASGQGMVLYRLLKDLDGAHYVLITAWKKAGEDSSPAHCRVALAGKRYSLRRELRIGNRFGVARFYLASLFNFLVSILQRSVRILRVLARDDCRVVICCSGDLYDIPSGAIAALLFKRPFVLYLFDDYAEQWPGNDRRIARATVRRLAKRSARVIVPNELLEQEYKLRYSLQAEVLHNPCPIPDLADLDKQGRLLNRGTVNIVYTGSIYHAHFDAFRNLLTAVRSLGRQDVFIHLFTAQSRKELVAENIAGREIIHHSHVDELMVTRIQREADILFLPLAFDSNIESVVRTSAPGKMGEYLAVGRPILVHAPSESYVAQYFSNHCCGIVVGKPDVLSLKDAVMNILSDKAAAERMGRKAREQAIKDFAIGPIRDRFVQIIREAAGVEGAVGKIP